MRVSELTGVALDWAVHFALHGSCEGYAEHEYSTDWSQGGSIIERERIAVTCTPDAWCAYAHDGLQDVVIHGVHAGKAYNWKYKQNAETPLIAAMRCYVASKLGDEVEIPAELLTKEKSNA